MTEYIPFSERYGYRPDKKGLIEQEVTKTARIGMCYIIEDQLDYANSHDLYSYICKFLRVHPGVASVKLKMARILDTTNPEKRVISDIIMECDWVAFYDLCELFYAFMNRGYEEEFALQVNKLFKEERLSYQMSSGKIEKLGNPITVAKIKEARILLKEPEFKGADEQFEKAIRALNVRPNPDIENCIKDAVGAIESVGRILTGDEKALLDGIIKGAVKNGIIPQPLDQTFIKLYAYRGNEPGVAHGAVGESKATIYEAELVLAMSAAMIIYLVEKRSLLHQ